MRIRFGLFSKINWKFTVLLNAFSIVLALATGCSSQPAPAPPPQVSQDASRSGASEPSTNSASIAPAPEDLRQDATIIPDTAHLKKSPPNYPAIFAQARAIMARPAGRKIRIQGKEVPLSRISETQLISMLVDNPDQIQMQSSETTTSPELIGREAWESVGRYDPTKHLRLVPPRGQSGYQNLRLYINHPHYRGRNSNWVKQGDDLRQVWIDFIRQAKKEIMVNVFDFDLMPVAQALAAKALRGVNVTVGIDSSVVEHRPQVKKVFDFLAANKVKVVSVNSVGLNHQKITIIDWSSSKDAKVLLSSGNLTQSCIGPEGDLVGTDIKSPLSIPNANHLMTMDSYILGNLIYHELAKTLGDNLQLRGSEYPLSGSYQITGPGVNPYTLEAYPEPSFVIAFSPRGGLNQINKTLIAKMIDMTSGPIYMVQFAFSSPEVANALSRRAHREYERNKKFEFYSVGDTPFAMQYWSQFLKMIGLKLIREDGRKEYVVDPESPWLLDHGSQRIKDIAESILIAPPVYGNYKVTHNNRVVDVTSKIHHKTMVSQDFAIMGTSFNFSSGAEKNNEQIVLWRDRRVVDPAVGMARFLFDQSVDQNKKRRLDPTVLGEASRRNKFREFEPDLKAELDKEWSAGTDEQNPN